MYYIFPKPKKFVLADGALQLTKLAALTIPHNIKSDCENAGFLYEQAISELFPSCQFHFSTNITEQPDPKKKPDSLNELDINNGENHRLNLLIQEIPCDHEGYILNINEEGIQISCCSGAGFFYSLKTLKQILDQSSHGLPFLQIEDEPSLKIRGLMLDIGRDKIPKMETLYRLIDLFAEFKLNHLQLYMEGFCFDYEQFRYLFSDETPMTPEEFRQLSAYAAKNFIDLVPNQNVLGHMEKWLEKPRFNGLAECEDGFLFENLIFRAPMTLDVNDEGSYELAVQLLETLIDSSSSDYINVNMDEPFEMGMGKNKEFADANGRIPLYFHYLKKIYDYCSKRGKKIFIWGDEILAHPEYVSELSKDIILMDWIYESDADFESHAKLFQQTGQKYCLCPGTSSWGSLTGRSDNMIKNIRNAVDNAIRYDGLGIITTDWGDLGHWQYLSVSYPAYAYTGYYSWSGTTEDQELISYYCNRYIYEDKEQKAFQTAIDLGNYYRLEHASLRNITLSFAVMSRKYVYNSIEEFDNKMKEMLQLSANIAKLNHIPEQPKVIDPDYEGIENYLQELSLRIPALELNGAEGALIKEEMLNGLAMVRHGITLYRTLKEYRNEKQLFHSNMDLLFEQLDIIFRKHYELWCRRNRTGGFSRSTSHFSHLLKLYRKLIK